jgi:hypothetical protein
MIKYKLTCGSGCAFEGWFRSSEDFDAQAGEGRLECPYCASTKIERAIMAPSLLRGGAPASDRASRMAEIREAMADAARRARDYVEKNFDYVGERFPEEARRIHYGETKHRDIYGEATGAEVKELVDEGVAIAPLPSALDPVADKKKVN